MNVDCRRAEDLFSAWLEDELTPEARAAVTAHLERCPGCADLFARAAGTRRALAVLPEVEPSPALLRRLEAIPARAAARPAAGRVARRSLLDVLLRPALQPVYAGGAALLLIATFFVYAPQSRPLKKAIDRTVHDGLSRVETLYVRAGSLPGEVKNTKDSLLGSLKELPPLRKTGNPDEKR